MKIIKPTLLLCTLFLFTNFSSTTEDIENIKLTDFSIEFVNLIPSNDISSRAKKSVTPSEGMTFGKLNLTLTNNSDTDSNIVLEDAYITDGKGNMYYITHYGSNTNSKMKFKPYEVKYCITYFEFPINDSPLKLFIEHHPFNLPPKE